MSKDNINVKEIPGCFIRIKGNYEGLRATEKKIGDYILKHPEEVIHLSVTELADRTSTSESSIVRFCQRIGYKGYQELKILLEQDLINPIQSIHEEINEEDDIDTIKRKIFIANAGALHDTLEVLENSELERAVEAIAKARRVDFYGMGGSGCVAQDAYHKFLKIGIPCIALVDCNLQVMSASLLGKEDVVIGISHTGSIRDTVEALQIAKEAGATTICITNHARSPIVNIADIKLFTASRETAFKSDATASRIAQLTIIDALYVGVALKRYEQSAENIRKTRKATVGKRY